MTNSPLLVGVTGGIGSGKSLVCQIFASLAVPIYDADQNAKRLMTENQTIIEGVQSAFGKESYQDDGKVNRTYLASRVFSNKEALDKLNAIVHPQVALDFSNWVKTHQNYKYLIKEAALIIESESNKTLDKLISVQANKSVRIHRVMMRDDHRSVKDIEEIIENQLSDNAFKKYADYLIDNNDGVMLLPQVMELHSKLKAL